MKVRESQFSSSIWHQQLLVGARLRDSFGLNYKLAKKDAEDVAAAVKVTGEDSKELLTLPSSRACRDASPASLTHCAQVAVEDAEARSIANVS
jgi:hypothetical protein